GLLHHPWSGFDHVLHVLHPLENPHERLPSYATHFGQLDTSLANSAGCGRERQCQSGLTLVRSTSQNRECVVAGGSDHGEVTASPDPDSRPHRPSSPVPQAPGRTLAALVS